MSHLKFRTATSDDAGMLFDWRNDPVTRANSKTTAVVPWADHVAWLTKRLLRHNPDLWVFEVDNVPVAILRIDDGQLSYTVAPERRGQGIATAMLCMARERWGALVAEIKPSNLASIRAARAGGHIVKLLDH